MCTLLVRRARRHKPFEPFAVQFSHCVDNADEPSEESVAVKIAREHVDAAPVQRNVLFPIAASLGIEPAAQEIVVRRAVRLVIGRSEEAEEILIRRQIAQSRQFEAGERNVVFVEIHGNDLFGICRKIVEDIAAAGSDGEHAVVRLDFERLQIDVGIFPNLVVDKSFEEQREQTFERAPFGGGRPCVRGAFEKQIGHGLCGVRTRIVCLRGSTSI